MSRPIAAQSATVTNPAASVTVITLFTAASGRGRRIIANDGSTALYVKFGAAASLTDWTVKIAIGGYYELPVPVYCGVVTGIWDTGVTGNARLTEY